MRNTEFDFTKLSIAGRPRGRDAETCDECDHGYVLVDDPETGALMSVPCSCREAAIERRRRALHPLVAEFLELVGPGEMRDVFGSRTAEAQVREKWQAFVLGRRRDLSYRGLEAAGLPALERANQRALAPMPADAALTDG